MEKFILFGGGGMEPPRPGDEALTGIGGLLRGHPIDPRAPAGRWEARLRLSLVGFMAVVDAPDTVLAEAAARHPHPSRGVLPPPTFTVVEVTEEGWRPLTGGADPDEARDRPAGYFAGLLPRLREFRGDPATPEEPEAWAGAAARGPGGAGTRVLGAGPPVPHRAGVPDAAAGPGRPGTPAPVRPGTLRLT